MIIRATKALQRVWDGAEAFRQDYPEEWNNRERAYGVGRQGRARSGNDGGEGVTLISDTESCEIISEEDQSSEEAGVEEGRQKRGNEEEGEGVRRVRGRGRGGRESARGRGRGEAKRPRDEMNESEGTEVKRGRGAGRLNEKGRGRGKSYDGEGRGRSSGVKRGSSSKQDRGVRRRNGTQ